MTSCGLEDGRGVVFALRPFVRSAHLQGRAEKLHLFRRFGRIVEGAAAAHASSPHETAHRASAACMTAPQSPKSLKLRLRPPTALQCLQCYNAAMASHALSTVNAVNPALPAACTAHFHEKVAAKHLSPSTRLVQTVPFGRHQVRTTHAQRGQFDISLPGNQKLITFSTFFGLSVAFYLASCRLLRVAT